jgi:hypothetical protein
MIAYVDYIETEGIEMTREEIKAKISELDTRLNKEVFASPDHYYATKDLYWRMVAQLQNKTHSEVNPVGFWHGGQSN